MNKKIMYVLAGIFVFLLVIYYVQKGLNRATSEPETLNQLSLTFDPDQVARIEVFKQDYPDSGLYFEKVDTTWVVSNEYNAPAKKSDIQKLIDDLDNVSGSIRGESADLYPDFDITDEKALQIRFLDPDSNLVLHLYVGKGGTGRETFVRVAGSPTTYLANENFISRFAAWNSPPEKKLPTDRWVELNLCDFGRDDISSFRIVKGKMAFEFANTEIPPEDSLSQPTRAWKQISPEKGIRLEESKIKSLSSSIAAIRARGVVDPVNRDKYGLDKPKNSVTINDNSGKAIVLSVSDPVNDDKDRYVVASGRDTVYRIDDATFERYFIKPFEEAK